MTTITVKALTDVHECATVARFTQGMEGDSLSLATWRKWLWSEHSMIRVFILSIEMRGIPYYASVHLVRHKIGVEHYVRSQRDTAMRPVDYDRRRAPQGALVNHMMVLNVQALIAISRRRLCNKADPVTRGIWQQVQKVIGVHEDRYIRTIAEVMMPNCDYRRGCHEIVSCSSYDLWRFEGKRNEQDG